MLGLRWDDIASSESVSALRTARPRCGVDQRFDERRKQEDYAAVERSKNRREAVPLQVVTWLGVTGIV